MIDQFQQGTADWRAKLRENEKKTKIVLAIFIGLYLLLGLLIDIFILMEMQNYPIGLAFQSLITFQNTPVATLIMAILAIISIAITYAMYDKLMLLGTEAKLIDPNHFDNEVEQQLYHVVEEMKIAAGLNYMPKVYLIEADYMNAFASGYSEKSAMVAITRGLINKLNRAELQAVMAHELSHIRHHDIKLTLMVGVLSNLMLIVVDILFYSVLYGGGRSRRNDKNNGAAILFIIIMLLRYLLPILTVVLSLFLSRTREYMADAGAVELTRDNAPLANALIKITYDHRENADVYTTAYGETSHEDVRRASYIYDPARISSVKSLNSSFSTHPTLEERLKSIGFTQNKT